jgi:D-alanyl-D-alanine carboxypeptidase
MRRPLALVLLAMVAVLAPPAAPRAAASPLGVPRSLAARLQQLVEEERVTLHAPGISAAVILPDGSVWTGQTGEADVAAAVPVGESTSFALGSITKTFVSATLLQLLQERRLSLEDPLSRWFPAWPNGRNITIRMLMSHTSGIFDYFYSPDYEHLVFGRPTHHWSLAEILTLVGRPYFAPGQGYRYSNTNYVLLGEIVRQITGHRPAVEIRRRFLQPLGLTHEAFQGEEAIRFIPAHSYLASGSGWTDEADGSRFRPNTSGATVASDAGAMLGNARDIAAWGRALYGGAILRPETLAELETPSDFEPYGLGTRQYIVDSSPRIAWGHGGSLRGTVNMVWHLPYERVTIAVLMNLGRVDPTPLTRSLAFATITALQLPAEAKQPPPVDSTRLAADYRVSAALDAGAGRLTASTTAHVVNAKAAPVSELAFELAPLGLGRATVGDVSVDGSTVQPQLRDQTIVVPLVPALDPGASVDVAIDYHADLAPGVSGSEWLFTRSGAVFAVHRWIPWLSVERPFDLPNQGEPFVTPVAGTVDVDLTTDVPLTVATGGVESGGSALHHVIHAADVRDLDLVASADFHLASQKVGGTDVRAFGDSDADALLLVAEAARALPRVAAKLGTYGFPTFTVARTAGGLPLASPGLAWIPAPARSTRYVVTREVALQWFSESVGTDQALEPFADEAPADLVARSLLGLVRASHCAAGRLDLPVYQVGNACYRERIGVGGAHELDRIRRLVGDGPFWSGIRAYLDAHRDRFGGTHALLAALDDATPRSLAEEYGLRFPRWY